jgi:hypothetical protein
MRRHGYSDDVAAGSVAAAGTLGILIPPSVILAIYSLVAEQSLAKLFAAALIPGLLLAALYVVAVVIEARLRPQAIRSCRPCPCGSDCAARAARGSWRCSSSSPWSASISAGFRPPRPHPSAPLPPW